MRRPYIPVLETVVGRDIPSHLTVNIKQVIESESGHTAVAKVEGERLKDKSAGKQSEKIDAVYRCAEGQVEVKPTHSTASYNRAENKIR